MRGALQLQQLLCYASCNSSVGAGAGYTVLKSLEKLHHWQSLYAHHLKHGNLKCTCQRWQSNDTPAHIAMHLLPQKDLETANTDACAYAGLHSNQFS